MLILTKLYPPALKSRMLFRMALTKRLSKAKALPIIFVTGPAGSGKTSLIRQWIEQDNFRIAWFTIDKEDNEPNLFFRYLLTALAQSNAPLNEALAPVLKSNRELSDDIVIPHIVTSLSVISQDIHLVLDDFHYVENEKIQAALARLIQYLPPCLHIVILSRNRLPAPMDAVILKKERMELSARDLKFTEKESVDLYKKVIPLKFTPHQIKTLNRHAEGWAAGLQLIGLSAKAKGPDFDLKCILNQVYEQLKNYLIHDILRMHPATIRNFIFTTALLDRFNPELCAHVTGNRDANKILAHLREMNLFLIPLDAQCNWYRYNHLFAEVIRQQSAVLEPDLIPATLRKAATWLARNNYLETALQYAFRSNDLEFAADLLEDYILVYIEAFDLSAGLRWILKLPEDLLRRRPLLRLQQCCLHSELLELSEIKEILLCMEKDGKPDFSRYSDEKKSLCRDYTAFLKSILRIWYAEDPMEVDQIRNFQDKVYPKNPLLVGNIETQIIFRLISKGNLKMAASFFSRISQVPLSNPTHRILREIYHAKIKALIAQHRGHLKLAETIILQALRLLNRQTNKKSYKNRPMASILYRHLGAIFYCQNRLKAARQCAARAEKFHESKFFGYMDQIMAGSELRLQLHRCAGEYEQALKYIWQMQAYFIKLEMPRITSGTKAFIAQIAMDQNNPAAAELWSDRRSLSPDEPFSLLFAVECLTQARLFYTCGKYDSAAHLLENLRLRCTKRGLGELVLKIDILYAAMLYVMNRKPEAISRFKKALAFAETEGYIRPFVTASPLISPILNHMVDASTYELSTDHFKKVLTACDVPPDVPAFTQCIENDLYEALTQREVEILRWMAQGFQNKEIAQKGYIAISTVKSHVSNILVKLNVKTRTQAILKAKEMNILKVE